jgi:hypothetical protein
MQAPMIRDSSRRRIVLSVVILCLLFGVLVLNVRYPVLRFTIQPLNSAVFVVVAFMPTLVATSLLCLASTWNRKWMRVSFQLLSAARVIVTAVLGFVAIVFGAGGPLVRTRLAAHGYAVTAYALDDGIGTYQEKPILPGLALVRRLDYIDDADQPMIEWVGADRARVTLTIYDEKSSKVYEDVRVYDLKPFVYF